MVRKVSVFLLFFSFLFAQKVSFNNDWQFRKGDSVSDKQNEVWERVNLPHTWNSKDMQSGPEFYAGQGLYKKELQYNPAWNNKRVFLKFNGVGQYTELFVNQKKVGVHKGGYSAFIFEITDYLLKDKSNKILVKADNRSREDVIPVNHNLFGVFGGIYRPAELIVKPKIAITPMDYATSGVYIDQNEISEKLAKFSIRTKIENDFTLDESIVLRTKVFDAQNKLVVKSANSYKIKARKRFEIKEDFEIKNPQLWNGKENPVQYKFVLEIVKNEKVIDSVTEYTGFRSFYVDSEKGFFLNGKPYRLYGVARHQDKFNKGAALSLGDHKKDFALIDEIGATSVRLAHYQQAKDVYSICDELGLVVWAEIPFVNALSLSESENTKEQLYELIRQNYNHPSICFWGIYNEIPAEVYPSYAKEIVTELQTIAKKEDAKRLTVCASASGDMENPIHWKTDLQAFNRYHGWYGGDVKGFSEEMDKMHGEAPEKYIGISEYGAGANVLHYSPNPEKPDPIGAFFPENYQAFFHEQHWKQIKKRPYLWATYIWNMFDFSCPTIDRGSHKAINHKGLVSYDRKTKKDAFYFYKTNWNSEPAVYFADKRHENVASEVIDLKIYCNQKEFTLVHNKRKVDAEPELIAPNTYVWKNIKLQEGKNKFVVLSFGNGKKISDSCEKMIKLQTPEVAFEQGNSALFYDETELKLISKDKAQIVYSFNNEEKISDGKNLIIDKSGTLKAYSKKKGYSPSESISVELLKVKKYVITKMTTPDPRYTGVENALSNLHKGDTGFRNKEWTGYEGRSAEFVIKPEGEISAVRVSYLVNKDAWIIPPKEIRVYGINKNNRAELLSSKNNFSWDIRLQEAVLSVDKKYDSYKIEIESFIKLPKWHSGSGKPAWIFLDEIICE